MASEGEQPTEIVTIEDKDEEMKAEDQVKQDKTEKEVETIEDKTEKKEAKTEKEVETIEDKAEKKEDKTEKKEATEDTKEESKENKAETTENKTESSESDKNKAEKKEENGSSEPASELEKKIIKQIEYYFGDYNLFKDKFLQGQMKQDNGWVTLDTLLKFHRLTQLSADASVIVAAVKKSSSGLMEVHEDGTKMRRNPEKPLPLFSKEKKDEMSTRSVYVKGLPESMTLESLEEFFSKFGKIDNIQMRRNEEKNFKGSVFVIFQQLEDTKKFLATESLKCEDSELKAMFKDDYFKMKNEDRKKSKETDLKDQEQQKKDQEKDEDDALKERLTKCSVISLEGLPNGLSLEDLRAKFEKFGEVAWIEFRRGDTDARVRFKNQDEAKTALEKAQEAGEGKVMVNDTEVKSRILEGDDELKYWRNFFNETKERKSRGNKRRGGRGGGPHHKRRKH